MKKTNRPHQRDDLSRRRRLKHGFYTENKGQLVTRTRTIAQLVEVMYRNMPWLEPSDRPVARSWAEIEVVASQVFANLMQEGLQQPTGEPRRMLDEYRKLRQTQLQFANSLGMTPAARKILQSDKNADLPLLLAQLAKKQPIVVNENGADT